MLNFNFLIAHFQQETVKTNIYSVIVLDQRMFCYYCTTISNNNDNKDSKVYKFIVGLISASSFAYHRRHALNILLLFMLLSSPSRFSSTWKHRGKGEKLLSLFNSMMMQIKLLFTHKNKILLFIIQKKRENKILQLSFVSWLTNFSWYCCSHIVPSLSLLPSISGECLYAK